MDASASSAMYILQNHPSAGLLAATSDDLFDSQLNIYSMAISTMFS